MRTIEETIHHAERKCRDRGTRLTPKRKLVLSCLLRSNKAMSAYELVDFSKDELGEAISAMSMYRILDFLQEEQFVHKLNLAKKFIACTHIDCGHSHDAPQFLICAECQRVEEINLGNKMALELKHNAEKVGFQLASTQLEVNCLCGDCSNEAA